MKRFSFKFIGAMLISGFITGVILNILFQFTFEGIRIDPENKQLPLMLGVMAVMSFFYVFFAVFYARLFAKYFKAREFTLKYGREFSFFRNYVIIAAIAIGADLYYLYTKSLPFFAAAYEDARMRIKIKDLNAELENKELYELEQSYEQLLHIIRIAAIVIIVLQAVAVILSAKKIVKAYREQKSILLSL